MGEWIIDNSVLVILVSLWTNPALGFGLELYNAYREKSQEQDERLCIRTCLLKLLSKDSSHIIKTLGLFIGQNVLKFARCI